MRLTSVLAIYVLFWTMSLFLVLPFGVRTTREVGGETVPGQSESAPHDFHAGRVAWRVTIVATTLFVLFQLNYAYGWITPQMFDLFDTRDMVRR